MTGTIFTFLVFTVGHSRPCRAWQIPTPAQRPIQVNAERHPVALRRQIRPLQALMLQERGQVSREVRRPLRAVLARLVGGLLREFELPFQTGEVLDLFSLLPEGILDLLETGQHALTIGVQRVWCRRCDAVQQVKLGIADPYRSYTRAFERYALDLCRSMTIQDVAWHLGVSWDVIKDIQKRHRRAMFGRPRLRDVRFGGKRLDTASIKHGRCLTRWQSIIQPSERPTTVVGEKLSRKSRVR